jgi:hypothetical protein
MKHVYFCETVGKEIGFSAEVPTDMRDLMEEHSTVRFGQPEFDCDNKLACPAKIITVNHDGTYKEHWDRCLVRASYLKAPHKLLGRAS